MFDGARGDGRGNESTWSATVQIDVTYYFEIGYIYSQLLYDLGDFSDWLLFGALASGVHNMCDPARSFIAGDEADKKINAAERKMKN